MSDWNPTSPEGRERLGRMAHAAYLSRVPEDDLLPVPWEELMESQRETFCVIAAAVARDAVARALREAERRCGQVQAMKHTPLASRAVLEELRAMLCEVEAAP